jgi:hypothetical protein
MTRTVTRLGMSLASAAAIGLLVLATPAAASAADEPLTGIAVAGAIEPQGWTDPGLDAGPVLLLLVAGTLGLLGVLSGPELAVPASPPDARPRRQAH